MTKLWFRSCTTIHSYTGKVSRFLGLTVAHQHLHKPVAHKTLCTDLELFRELGFAPEAFVFVFYQYLGVPGWQLSEQRESLLREKSKNILSTDSTPLTTQSSGAGTSNLKPRARHQSQNGGLFTCKVQTLFSAFTVQETVPRHSRLS